MVTVQGSVMYGLLQRIVMLSNFGARNTLMYWRFCVLFQHKDRGITADSSHTVPTSLPWDAHTHLFDHGLTDRL